jgi:hypothetical protein
MLGRVEVAGIFPYSGIVFSKQLGRGEVDGIFPYSGMVFSKQLGSVEGAGIPLLRDGIFYCWAE